MTTIATLVQLLLLVTATATPTHVESYSSLNVRDDSTNELPTFICSQDYHGVNQLERAREAVAGAQHIASRGKYQIVGFQVPAAHTIFKDRDTERAISDIYTKAST